MEILFSQIKGFIEKNENQSVSLTEPIINLKNKHRSFFQQHVGVLGKYLFHKPPHWKINYREVWSDTSKNFDNKTINCNKF